MCCTGNYSRTLMAQTPMRPLKFVQDMGSLSHWGLIMASGLEANSDNLGKYTKMEYCVYSLELPWWGDSNEYTQPKIWW